MAAAASTVTPAMGSGAGSSDTELVKILLPWWTANLWRLGWSQEEFCDLFDVSSSKTGQANETMQFDGREI